MLKNLSNKELVAAGHKFAANISADTPLLDMAKMVSELATHLDVTLAAAAEAGKQRDTLATENAALISYIDGECYTESKRTGMYTCAGMNKPASPATEAYLNAVRADAISYALKECSDHCDNDYVMDAYDFSYETAEMRSAGAVDFRNELAEFAARLRAGNAKDGV